MGRTPLWGTEQSRTVPRQTHRIPFPTRLIHAARPPLLSAVKYLLVPCLNLGEELPCKWRFRWDKVGAVNGVGGL